MPRARAASQTRHCVHRHLNKADNRKRELRIGISGWRYARWRRKFYPESLPHRSELEFASGVFNSIEINGSFYALQRPSSYQRWYAATPPDFVFTVKGGRFITHVKKLHDIETPLASFFGSGVLALREKIGPILWQLPPNLGFDPERLRNFLELLPRNTKQASDLAAKHNEKLKARAFLKIDPAAAGRPLRYALEVPHPSFMTADFFELLRRRTIAFVIADTAKKFPYTEDLTGDFVYCRLHGDKELCASGYSAKALNWWANRIDALARRQAIARRQFRHRAQDRQPAPRCFCLF